MTTSFEIVHYCVNFVKSNQSEDGGEVVESDAQDG